ncbi:endo alpha-1,4 polygalactosaminidase [Cordyceps militaris CM01]|uniref:alpha-galactosidase n=1 Tax=Cordyceps militaris (strain CM01) TaxID=983644 RepID=G3JTT9_CORMM|nr:endo alpha-1,4 polygalactosaminidase [Cordyceps militaris CM01]EGX88093.1 endo alpha-1,4 polygalactosaminidase [Cordyceps militaris CM01]
MKYSATLAALVPLAAAVGKVPDKFKPGARWQVEIQNPLIVPSSSTQKLVPDADIWDIDLWHADANRSIIPALHAHDKIVICYLNLGAVQPDECDFNTSWYKDGGKDNKWTGPWYYDANYDPDSPDNEGNRYCERYVDFTDTPIRDLMKARLKTARDLGCDGVDPDNIDISSITWGSGATPPTRKQVSAALVDLAAYAHSMTSTRGFQFLIGQKNGAEYAADLVGHYDFAVLERCLEAGFCGNFTGYLAAGKPVLAIEYPASLEDAGDGTSGCNMTRESRCESGDADCPCRDIGGEPFARMDRVLKLDFDDFGLNGCTQYCDSRVVVTPTDTDNKGVCRYGVGSVAQFQQILTGECVVAAMSAGWEVTPLPCTTI